MVWNSDYIDKVFMQSVNSKRIRNFLMLFCLLFAKVVSPKAKKFVKTRKFSLFQFELI